MIVQCFLFEAVLSYRQCYFLVFPYFLSDIVVSESCRTAHVSVCATSDAEILWNGGANDDFDISTVSSTAESCGAEGYFVMTSSIFKRTSGQHTFSAEIVTPACGDGEKPRLEATCTCSESDTCELILLRQDWEDLLALNTSTFVLFFIRHLLV